MGEVPLYLRGEEPQRDERRQRALLGELQEPVAHRLDAPLVAEQQKSLSCHTS